MMVNFKLISRSLLSILGLYLLWCSSYFILTKFALIELNNLRYMEGSAWKSFSPDRVFWYFIYFGAMAFIIYLTRLLIRHSPKPALTAAIFVVLVILSAGVLVYSLANQSNAGQLTVHILINLSFIISAVPSLMNYRIKPSRQDAHFV